MILTVNANVPPYLCKHSFTIGPKESKWCCKHIFGNSIPYIFFNDENLFSCFSSGSVKETFTDVEFRHELSSSSVIFLSQSLYLCLQFSHIRVKFIIWPRLEIIRRIEKMLLKSLV